MSLTVSTPGPLRRGDGEGQAGSGMIQHEPGAALSIQRLPSIVVQLLERAPGPLLPGVQGPLGLFVRYLRRKPGRGLVVLYHVAGRTAPRVTRGSTPERWISLTASEA